MRIKTIETTTVCVPFEAPLWSIWGVREGITRTLVRIETDNGLEGWGEAHGRLVRVLIEEVKQVLLGEDPREYKRLGTQLRNYGSKVAAIFEMAFLDLAGKERGISVSELLGQPFRQKIPFSGYVFYRAHDPNGKGGELDPNAIARFCSDVVKKYGFRVLKLKGSVHDPQVEIDTLCAIQKAVGDDIRLRWDANGGWAVQTAVQLIKEIEALGLNMEYVEDPTPGLAGLSEVTKRVGTPIATDTWITSTELLAAAIRLEAVDVVMADVERWGGIVPLTQLATVAATMGVGLSMHSWGQLGIATAAQLHFGAVTPHLTYAVDAHYHHQLDDIIVGGSFQYTNGMLSVPTGPGLGVTVDPMKLELYEEEYRRRVAEADWAAHGFESDVDDPCRRSWKAVPGLR